MGDLTIRRARVKDDGAHRGGLWRGRAEVVCTVAARKLKTVPFRIPLIK